MPAASKRRRLVRIPDDHPACLSGPFLLDRVTRKRLFLNHAPKGQWVLPASAVVPHKSFVLEWAKVSMHQRHVNTYL